MHKNRRNVTGISIKVCFKSLRPPICYKSVIIYAKINLMTFSLHKILLASITLIITILTGFVIPAAAEELSNQVSQSSQSSQSSQRESSEATVAEVKITSPSATHKVVQDEVKADTKAKINFERTPVTTKPDPAIAIAKAKKEAEEKAAKEKAAADAAQAKKDAATAAAQVAEAKKVAEATGILNQSAPAAAAGPAIGTSAGAVKDFARTALSARGWGEGEFQCLNNLWERESNWNYQASNASSGAYGIPQSLPGNKMSSIAPDWQTNPKTQILWGLGYIAERYGTPCGAWGHSESIGWY